MGSIFGWSLPPGCGRLPGEEPEPVQPRCDHCRAFLPWKPDKSEPWEDECSCDGVPDFYGFTVCGQGGKHLPHKLVVGAGVSETRRCRRCGFENVVSV